jgi:hypothetical protein
VILAYRRRRLTHTTVREPAAACRVLPGATAQPATDHTTAVPCDCCSDGLCVLCRAMPEAAS